MRIRIYVFISLILLPLSGQAADLLEVFDQAQHSDAIYQQAISQRLSDKEGVPISISSLLPDISLSANPSITRTGNSGSLYDTDLDGTPFAPRNTTTRAYTLSLVASQTIFDFAQFANVAGALSFSKGADATLNAALQDLMLRVSKAYFTILEDEDNLRYSKASKLTFAEQLNQAKYQYEVGLKTLTDVYTAQARYDSAVANEIAAQTKLSNDRENLRVISGKYYAHLAPLSERFPLIKPQPSNVEVWVKTAEKQNWTVRKFQYAVDTSRQTIRQQFAGHLPTIEFQGLLNRQYVNNLTSVNSVSEPSGPGTQTNRQVMLNINMPIFSGGGVVAKTNQAVYDFQVTEQQLEQIFRDTINKTRQSYLNVISGISKILADKQAIKSNKSSLEGMEASYQAGTETLVNVLNQQEILFQSQTQYAKDRYAYVNDILALKQAAGTLGFDDLCAINAWLGGRQSSVVYRKPVKLKNYSHVKKKSNIKPKSHHLSKTKSATSKSALKPAKKLVQKHKRKKHSLTNAH